jgi:hypothetical protein
VRRRDAVEPLEVDVDEVEPADVVDPEGVEPYALDAGAQDDEDTAPNA